jgi:hypothetical protein
MTDANGTWIPFGYQTGVTNGQTHTFEILLNHPGSTYRVDFRIDGNLKYSTSSPNFLFGTEDLGLESYCAECTVQAYVNGVIKNRDQSYVWHSWASTSGSGVNHPPMCGSFVTTYYWRSGEAGNATC